MVTIIENIDLVQEADNYDVLLVGTSIYGRLSNGWQLDAKLTFPLIHKVNIETKYGDATKLGKCIDVEKIDTKQVYCLLYITKGNFRPDLQKDTLDYNALEECLHKINIKYKGKRIACPILGTSKFDGNGEREKVIDLFNKKLTDVDCTLYDYEQTSEKERNLNLIKEIMSAKTLAKKTNDKSKYYELVKKRKAYCQRLKAINNLTIFENT